MERLFQICSLFCRGIMPFVKPEKRFFNKEKFLAGLDVNEKEFYKAVSLKLCVNIGETRGYSCPSAVQSG